MNPLKEGISRAQSKIEIAWWFKNHFTELPQDLRESLLLKLASSSVPIVATMNSSTLKSFWDEYWKLDQKIREQAKKSFRLWTENPFHPSLRFKCINQSEKIWAVRVSLGYRALGVMDGDTVT